MDEPAQSGWRFVRLNETEVERLPGKTHHWYCPPGKENPANLLFVRAHLAPGHAHHFHHHPHMEEVLYILSGRAEQWVERESRIMEPGDSFYVPAGVVHATFNTSPDMLEFLAVLSPAAIRGPITVEVGNETPWRDLGPIRPS